MQIRKPVLTGIGQHRSSKGAWEAENWAFDQDTLGFTNARGYVSYFNGTGAEQGYPSTDIASIYWYRRNSIDYLLMEMYEGSTRKIVYFTNNGGYKTINEVLDLSHITNKDPSESGTQYVPFGNFLAIFAEGKQPIKFFGNRIEPFGWDMAPPQLEPYNPPSNHDYGDPAGVPGASASFVYTTRNVNPENEVGIAFETNNYIGFGEGDGSDAQIERRNTYGYKVSYTSDTGSESPLSEASAFVTWIGGDDTGGTKYDHTYGLFVDGVPVGPEGTVRRNIYRTQNMKDGINGAGEVYYLIDTIPNNFDTIYTDVVPDSGAAVSAPSFLESMPLPRGLKYAAAYKNRMIIASSSDHPARLWWSNANAPEQFAYSSYIDFGNTSGSPITGLYAYKELVLIFRSDSIDALTPTGDTSQPFNVTPIIEGTGCVASKSIQALPNLGVIFLGSDGFYLIQGNFSGGGQVSVQKLSLGLGHNFETINRSALGKACATYNKWDNEYWCQVPAYGQTYANLGFVYHVDANAWTTRTDVPAACFTQSPDAFTLFGSNAGEQGLDSNKKGIHTWCAVRQHGATIPLGSQSRAEDPSPASAWRSHWLDFEAPSISKVIRCVEVEIVSTGEGTLQLESRIDYEEQTLVASSSETVSEPYSGSNTRYYTPQELEHQDRDNYGKFSQATLTTSSGAGITSRMSPSRTTIVRFDIDSTTCHQYSFRLVTSSHAILLGYTVYFEQKGEQKAYSGTFNGDAGGCY
jgi:hypothetical protein